MMIRQAVLADVESLVPLFDAYRSFFAGATPAGSREFLTERLQKGDAVFFMSFEAKTATGFLTLYPLFSSWHAARIWFLSDLYVAPEYRKQRLGRTLVAAAQTFANENSSRSIMVEIPHREPHLVRFYESLGFQRDKDFDLYRYYQTG
ncbi:MAG: GNAT family N-acetyltransferase [Candidatus Eremiobacteraeota bacterium]|nr:GNAT family N-acetyltransferase [Candidatus Eremiobacteraeota bacterium]